MDDRRTFLKLAALGAAGASVASPARADASVEVGGLFAPIAEKGAVGLGWHLLRVWPPVAGAVTLTLLHEDGVAARVDVCRREGAVHGPGSTPELDFVIMDGSDGRANESLGRVVRVLAAAAAANTEAWTPILAALESHATRVAFRPRAVEAAARSLVPA
jgi:hypothetical protein